MIGPKAIKSNTLLVLIYPVLTCLSLFSAFTFADENDYLQTFTDNMRWNADFSSRLIHNTDSSKTASMAFIGYDIHSVISNSKKDIATIVLQNYLIRADDLNPHPGIFSDEDDWAFTYRSFFINYTNTCSNCPNIKLGHFKMPYGLEHEIDTQGELRDYNHTSNIGMKMDWGVSLNKQHRNYEYEFSYTLGSGAYLSHQSGRYIITGRIASPSYKNFSYGLSIVDVNTPNNQRQKAAIDIKYYRGFFGYLFELGSGKHNSQSVIDNQIEINWRDIQERWLLFAQSYYSKVNNQTSKRTLAIGARFEQDQRWTFEAKINQALQSSQTGKRSTTVLAQIRYRY